MEKIREILSRLKIEPREVGQELFIACPFAGGSGVAYHSPLYFNDADSYSCKTCKRTGQDESFEAEVMKWRVEHGDEEELDDLVEDDQDDDGLEATRVALSLIPKEIRKTALVRKLQPVLEQLLIVDKVVAKSFIMNDVKVYFELTTGEARDYVTRLQETKQKWLLEQKEKHQRKERELPLITERDINPEEVQRAVAEVGVVSDEMLEMAVAVCVSSRLQLTPPLWLLIIGAPSSVKTELVGLLGSVESVFTLDTLTDNAFVSGFVPLDGSEPQDLLPLLDGKCFIVKDLTTIFSLKEDSVKKLLGDLTSIFDGTYEKFTATRGGLSYNSLFSMIGCITPAILNKHHQYVNQLGPRFFFLRVPELNDEKRRRGFEIAWKSENLGESRREKIATARQIVSSYAAQLIKKIGAVDQMKITDTVVQQWLNTAANFVSRARGIAITRPEMFTNEKGEAVEYYEVKDWQIEEPWRALGQLKGFIKILAFMRGKEQPTLDDCRALRPLILSTMQVDRSEIMRILVNTGGLSRKQIAEEIKKSTKTVGRTLKELELLDLVNAYKKPTIASGKSPWFYFVSESYADILDAVIPTPEFVSQSISGSNQTTSDDEDVDMSKVPF